MNILIISKRFYPELGGGETVLWQLSKYLSKKHDVHIITAQYNNSPKYENLKGVKIHRIIKGNNSIINDLNFSLKLFLMKKFILHFIENNKIEIIWNVGYAPLLPIGFISKKKAIPNIAYITAFFGKTWFKLVNPLFASFYYIMPIFTLLFSHYDYLICPSQNIINEIKNYTKSKTIAIPSPIDICKIKRAKINKSNNIRSELKITKQEKFILYVGRLSPEKNCLELINQTSKLNINYKLVIVGEGPERNQITKLINKYQLNEKIILLGKQSHSSTLSIMSECDVLILPSKTEVFPTVVLEGLSLNKPVISTNVGGVSEIKSKNLHMIKELNEINNIIEAPLISKTENFAEKYSIKKVSNELEELFKNIINR